MKKLIIAALALVGFSAASFAQTVPAVKKNDPSKMQVVKKATDRKLEGKVVAMNKITKQTSPVSNNAVTKRTPVKKQVKNPVTTKPVASISKVNSSVPLKKDGTADMRYKANKYVVKNPGAAHLKNDGTSDKRFKENKKHS